MELTIKLAYDELDKVEILFNEYTSMLGLNLAFQNYEDELNSLPSMYGLPNGRLYIAAFEEDLAGCIALRPCGGDICEMKRLFVRPAFRGLKIGGALVNQIIADARAIGYGSMVLDTLPALDQAIHLYTKLGFYETAPYYDNPIKNAIFMKKDL